jgi:hypothetical protein
MGTGLEVVVEITHDFTHALSDSIEQSPSWEANGSSATQEIPRILWNPKVHHRIYKSPPPVSIVRQTDPVYAHPSNLSKIHFNIIFPSTPGSFKCSPSPQVSSLKTCMHLSFPPYMLTHALAVHDVHHSLSAVSRQELAFLFCYSILNLPP